MTGKGKKRTFVVFFIVAVAVGAWYITESSKKKRIKSKGETFEVPFKKEGSMAFLKADGDTIRVLDIEIADNEAQQAQGLMYRGTMSDRQAMIFIFPREEPRTFWMKNTYISLDILFASEDGIIVSMAPNTRPYSEDPILSEGKAKYVIEVVAGFCAQYGVEEGDKMVFQRQ